MAPRSEARYNVPRRWLPASSTGWKPISNPRSNRYPSGPGTAGTALPATYAGYAANRWPLLSYRTAATMCGSARRAERSSLASASLAKAREAVLFAAMIRPRTDRASRVARRRDQYWYPANATDVSSRTSPLINTSIAVSFCLIGQSRSPISAPRRGDDLGHPQQLGAERKLRRFRCLGVYLEPDTAPVGHEANHASPFRESVGVTHREDRPVLEMREYLLRRIPPSPGPTDEQNVAARDVFDALIALDDERPRAATFSPHGGIEEAAERVATQNPDDQRRLRVGNGLRRPIDELREVEQEDGLDLSLGGLRRLRFETGGAHQQQRGDRSQKRHVTAPYTPRWMSRRVGLVAAPNSRCWPCSRFCPTRDRSRCGVGCQVSVAFSSAYAGTSWLLMSSIARKPAARPRCAGRSTEVCSRN